jgi:hypothetical protein
MSKPRTVSSKQSHAPPPLAALLALLLALVSKETSPERPVTIEALRGAQRLTFKVHGGPLGVGLADLPPAPATRP